MTTRAKRYVTETATTRENVRETIRESARKLMSENLERMRRTQNRPDNMKYFDEIADIFGKREKEIQSFKEKGGKVIGYFCALAPIELIYAVGAIPIRLCSGIYDTVRLGEEILPVEVCPIAKSYLGLKIARVSPLYDLCDAIINTTTCDVKTKLGEIMEDYLPVWTLNLPCIKEKPRNKRHWIEETNELKIRIEELTDKKISKENLRSSIEMMNEGQKEFRRLYDIRKAEVPTIMGRDAMLVSETLFHDDLKRWTQMTKQLCDELDDKLAKKKQVVDKDSPRIMLTGSPIIWPNWKIPDIVEELGGIIVCDEFCSSKRILYEPIEIDRYNMNEMIRAISDRYFMPCTCPCFTPNDDRVDSILQMIKDFKVDGVIYHVLRGCHVFSIESIRIKKALEQKNVPMYRIESEYSLEDIGQIKTRIEAFLEMLKARK